MSESMGKPSIAAAIRAAGVSPGIADTQAAKKNFAEVLSRKLAQVFADTLRHEFEGVLPSLEGRGHESPARGSRGAKKLDVNYSTPELGLGLGISIKTINAKDPRTKRYTKNLTRVDGELRAEASDYHRRQPYSVLVAVVFLPLDSCHDGGTDGTSSFGSAVRAFRPRNQRKDPTDEADTFELVLIALYEADGPLHGTTLFFDVRDTPPRRGVPDTSKTFDFEAALRRIKACYDARNHPPFRFAEDETPT